MTSHDVIMTSLGGHIPHPTMVKFDLTMMLIAFFTFFEQVRTKSRREINQFCFGSTFVQLNPNYRKFERMDPLTWKKEGIASQWAGIRGLRKTW